MENYVNGDGIPMGFGMILAQNGKALKYFSTLPKTEQQRIISGTHQIGSHQEMEQYVNNMIAEN